MSKRQIDGESAIKSKGLFGTADVPVFTLGSSLLAANPDYAIFRGSCSDLITALPTKPLFDLVVTSPPYNIGKPYEQVVELRQYRGEQQKIIEQIVKRLKTTGSICWQVGNYIVNSSNNRGSVYPLDYLFHPIF
ncbi:MAG TPA: DNA methyltransferase, partial [Pirellula sp.]|nr:DNA methyltransferase [Pirellula sp.]